MEAGEGVGRAVRKLGGLEKELGDEVGILTALYWRRKKPIVAAVKERYGRYGACSTGNKKDYVF